MKQRIVEGGCTDLPIFPRISRLGRKLTIDHLAYVVSWPWRTLRRLLPRVRPGA